MTTFPICVPPTTATSLTLQSSGVSTLPSNSLAGFTKLETLTISLNSNLRTIASNAFRNSTSTNFELSGNMNLTKIEAGAFANLTVGDTKTSFNTTSSFAVTNNPILVAIESRAFSGLTVSGISTSFLDIASNDGLMGFGPFAFDGVLLDGDSASVRIFGNALLSVLDADAFNGLSFKNSGNQILYPHPSLAFREVIFALLCVIFSDLQERYTGTLRWQQCRRMHFGVWALLARPICIPSKFGTTRA
eukprot:m.31456 g.31456  ORF g.31456 m.31456 type:complete len:247 (+) comp41783_c3_seq1:331-1071(+)